MTTFKSTLRTNLGEDETDWQIDYAIYHGEPAVMYDRNGEGYPGSDPELELLDARCEGVLTDLPNEFEKGVRQSCWDDAAEKSQPCDRDDMGEWE